MVAFAGIIALFALLAAYFLGRRSLVRPLDIVGYVLVAMGVLVAMFDTGGRLFGGGSMFGGMGGGGYGGGGYGAGY